MDQMTREECEREIHRLRDNAIGTFKVGSREWDSTVKECKRLRALMKPKGKPRWRPPKVKRKHNHTIGWAE